MKEKGRNLAIPARSWLVARIKFGCSFRALLFSAMWAETRGNMSFGRESGDLGMTTQSIMRSFAAESSGRESE
jgi:hypothetical protein